MANVSKAFGNLLSSKGSALRRHNGLAEIAAVWRCTEHFEDSPERFVHKHGPYFLHRRELAQFTSSQSQPHSSSVLHRFCLGKNPGDISSHDQLTLATVYSPKSEKFKEIGSKISRIVQLEVMKRKLQAIPEAHLSYQQFLKICGDCAGNSSEDDGRDLAKWLEQSGNILKLGQIVYLHPEQIARAVENVLALSTKRSSCGAELEKLEKEKMEIEAESERMVRREAWCGLAFLSVQTMGLCRLTFWELSWDVMEPICFYLTSVYCLLGYAFFIKTSSDPNFSSLFAARLKMKQAKLMRKRNFNLERYSYLQRICRPH